ncbi:MAG TPA: hypothetical protein VFG05_05960 [Methylocella sp.]|nr:hypothetical protein [Methylocella sp.]
MREPPDRDLDAGERDEGSEGFGEVLVTLGDAAVAAEPGEGSLDGPTARQDGEALQAAATLDGLEAQHGGLCDGSLDLPGIAAIVRPDQAEPGEAMADFVEDEGAAAAVLEAGGVNGGPDRQPFGIGKGVNLTPLDLLSGVIACLAVEAAPLSAGFKEAPLVTPVDHPLLCRPHRESPFQPHCNRESCNQHACNALLRQALSHINTLWQHEIQN